MQNNTKRLIAKEAHNTVKICSSAEVLDIYWGIIRWAFDDNMRSSPTKATNAVSAQSNGFAVRRSDYPLAADIGNSWWLC